jgi:hypothetical protein
MGCFVELIPIPSTRIVVFCGFSRLTHSKVEVCGLHIQGTGLWLPVIMRRSKITTDSEIYN